MSPGYDLQEAYLVAELPKPLLQTEDEYAIGKVYGILNSRKRRRPEVVLGINGEGLRLYDIRSSKLIASYAVSPQSTFACSPCSVRIRTAAGAHVRRTYALTEDGRARVQLFTDATGKGGMEQSVLSVDISGRVLCMEVMTTSHNNTVDCHLLVVFASGDILCLHGSTLQEIWRSSMSSLLHDHGSGVGKVTVEHAHVTHASALQAGMFKHRYDMLDLFSQPLTETFDPDILVTITESKSEGQVPTKHLHFFAMPGYHAANHTAAKSTVVSVAAIKLPDLDRSPMIAYGLDIAAGQLQCMSRTSLAIVDIANDIATIRSTKPITFGTSMLSLSTSTVVICMESMLCIYNAKYDSIMSRLELDSDKQLPRTTSLKRKRPNGIQHGGKNACRLHSFHPKLGLVVALMGTRLLTFQVGSRTLKQRPERLIHCLGTSTLSSSTIPMQPRKSTSRSLGQPFGASADEEAKSFEDQCTSLDRMLEAGDKFEAETLLRRQLGIKPRKIVDPDDRAAAASKNPHIHIPPSFVDRRWVSYALRRIFAVRRAESGRPKLYIAWYPAQIFKWLTRAGHITVEGIEAALASEAHAAQLKLSAGSLVGIIIEKFPQCRQLHEVLSFCFLDCAELLCAIRCIMASLEYFGPDRTITTSTSGKEPYVAAAADGNDAEQQILTASTELDMQLRIAEDRLQSDQDMRARALDLALLKLYGFPSQSITQAMRNLYSTLEIVSLVHLLRMELVRGSWTTKYTDLNAVEPPELENEASDDAIILIPSLLNDCIDALGTGGWLANTATRISDNLVDSEMFIASLRLEIAAALDGVEDLIYLNGLMSEVFRYGQALQRTREHKAAMDAATPNQDRILRGTMANTISMLPMGLKTETPISHMRVHAGGEIRPRTSRELAWLQSRAIEVYSRERIAV